jgi:hypothetical protein
MQPEQHPDGLNREVKKRWAATMESYDAEKSESENILGYPTANLQAKRIPGVRGYVAVDNPGRREREDNLAKDGIRTRRDEFPVNEPFGTTDDFNLIYNRQPGQRLFEADELNLNSKAVIHVNKYWHLPDHFLLIPYPAEDAPQLATARALAAAFEYQQKDGDPNVRLGLNSRGARASVNHLHFQGWYIDEDGPMAIETAERDFVATLGDDVSVEALANYPVRGFVFSGQNHDALINYAMMLLKNLQDQNVPHYVLISGNSIYILPASREPSTDEFPGGLGVLEVAGRINLPADKYASATDEMIDGYLQAVAIDPTQFEKMANSVRTISDGMELPDRPEETAVPEDRSEIRSVGTLPAVAAEALPAAVQATETMRFESRRSEMVNQRILAQAARLEIRLDEELQRFTENAAVMAGLGAPVPSTATGRGEILLELGQIGNFSDPRAEVRLIREVKASNPNLTVIVFASRPEMRQELIGQFRNSGVVVSAEMGLNALSDYLRAKRRDSRYNPERFSQLQTDDVLDGARIRSAIIGAVPLSEETILVISSQLNPLVAHVIRVAEIIRQIFVAGEAARQIYASA